MNLYELMQTMTAMASIAMILVGSAWLKRYLKAVR